MMWWNKADLIRRDSHIWFTFNNRADNASNHTRKFFYHAVCLSCKCVRSPALVVLHCYQLSANTLDCMCDGSHCFCSFSHGSSEPFWRCHTILWTHPYTLKSNIFLCYFIYIYNLFASQFFSFMFLKAICLKPHKCLYLWISYRVFGLKWLHFCFVLFLFWFCLRGKMNLTTKKKENKNQQQQK